MKRRLPIIIAFAAVALAIGAGVGAYAASNAGSASDPLISKSYAEGTLTTSILDDVDSKIAESEEELTDSFDAAVKEASYDGSTYNEVNVKSGAVITLSSGSEMILRSGSVSVTSGSVVDSTAGTSITSGALAADHLVIASASSKLSVSSAAVVLIRGEYSVS